MRDMDVVLYMSVWGSPGSAGSAGVRQTTDVHVIRTQLQPTYVVHCVQSDSDARAPGAGQAKRLSSSFSVVKSLKCARAWGSWLRCWAGLWISAAGCGSGSQEERPPSVPPQSMCAYYVRSTAAAQLSSAQLGSVRRQPQEAK